MAMALPVFAGGSSPARSLAPAGHEPQGLWLGEWREGRLLPITHTAGSVPATTGQRGPCQELKYILSFKAPNQPPRGVLLSPTLDKRGGCRPAHTAGPHSRSYGYGTGGPEGLKQRFSAGRFCLPGDIWRHLWSSQPGGDTAGTRGWGPGMMLNILQHTGQTPTQKIMISSTRPQCPGRETRFNGTGTVCSTAPGARCLLNTHGPGAERFLRGPDRKRAAKPRTTRDMLKES